MVAGRWQASLIAPGVGATLVPSCRTRRRAQPGLRRSTGFELKFDLKRKYPTHKGALQRFNLTRIPLSQSSRTATRSLIAAG
jgi:hypothetical protein